MIRVAPQFPPLIKGMAAGPANPLTIATAEAQRGTDAGLLVWSLTDDRMRAALVLAPETPLSHAASALVACGVGLQNALGVLVPPETAVHLEWAGGIRLNGGHAGGMRLYSSTRDPDEIPDWLIVSLELTMRLPDKAEIEPGETPDWTALDQEGAGRSRCDRPPGRLVQALADLAERARASQRAEDTLPRMARAGVEAGGGHRCQPAR